MDAAQRIFDDLLNLEVSVILKPGMTARKMPTPAHALLDVIGDYNRFLCHLVGELTEGRAAVPVPAVVSYDTFHQLREWAVAVEGRRQGASEDADGPVLKRIYRNCDQIKGILGREDIAGVLRGTHIDRDTPADDAALPLTSDDLVTLRKVWEIGVETVVMQTVVQLDGDIVTRVQTGRDTAANRAIHDLHRQSVESALAHWHFLGKTLAEFLSTTLRSFFLRPSGRASES